jgi:hypothetical protein
MLGHADPHPTRHANPDLTRHALPENKPWAISRERLHRFM